MRKLALTLCAASALMGGNLAIQPAMAGVTPAGAIPAAPPDGLEEVQYIWRGRSYCFYFDGWNGPGWYRCGWRHRRGMGWGGPMGWRGWDAPRGGIYRERPRGREMDRDWDRAPRREMERGPERSPERGAAPGGERRPPPAGERSAAPSGERRAPSSGGEPRSAPGGERAAPPAGERSRDLRPPTEAPSGGAPAPRPN